MTDESMATTESQPKENASSGGTATIDERPRRGNKYQVGNRRLPPHVTIRVLVAIHLVAGIVSTGFASREATIATMIFMSIVLCQSSLVGMWGALARFPFLVRIICVAAAVTSLGLELTWAVGFPEGIALFPIAVLATLPVTVVMWVVRRFWATIRWTNDSKGATHEGLQFSIRSLMLLTFAIACLLTMGRVASPYLPHVEFVTRLFVIGICSVSISLTAIWATLGFGNPLIRCVLVFAIAGTAGWIVGGTVSIFAGFWIGVMLLHTIFLLSSLFVVRRCGYRLVAKESGSMSAA